MKNHRFPWLRNRTTDNRKCEKARNIKEKRTIEMFSTASKPPVVRLSSASADFTQASKCRPTGRHFVCASCMQNKNAGPPKQTCVLLGKRGGKQHTGGNLVCVYPHTLWNNFTSREVKLMNLM